MSILNSIIRKIKSTVNNDIRDGIEKAIYNAGNVKKTVVCDELPENLEQLKALPGADLKDPYAVAAMTVFALCRFDKDEEAAIEMLNYLKGPRPLTNMEISFIRDRFMDGVDYVPRSYLNGTSPDNDYTPTVPYSITVYELKPSRLSIDDGYLRIYVKSSGADSERFIDLRLKPSTEQWFLWEFAGILSGIRIPKSQNAWA